MFALVSVDRLLRFIDTSQVLVHVSVPFLALWKFQSGILSLKMNLFYFENIRVPH